MKELSIEQKAQKYDNLIKRLKDFQSEYKFKTIDEYFPELKESDDGRIKEELILYLKGITFTTIERAEQVRNWIAWLEKQGEKKSNEVKPKFKIGDIVRHKDNPHITYVLKRFTDNGDYEFHAIGKDGTEGGTNFVVVKYQDEWELVEQKPACSEEDEKMFECALNMIEWYSVVDKDKSRSVSDWLKFLKGRVQPKVEWSEEDEEMLNVVIKSCEKCGNEYAYYWLKSLKDRVQPQTTWKPSDEQMRALTFVCIKNKDIDKSSIKALYDLKEQLKRL